jgi:hypothetical protein
VGRGRLTKQSNRRVHMVDKRHAVVEEEVHIQTSMVERR